MVGVSIGALLSLLNEGNRRKRGRENLLPSPLLTAPILPDVDDLGVGEDGGEDRLPPVCFCRNLCKGLASLFLSWPRAAAKTDWVVGVKGDFLPDEGIGECLVEVSSAFRSIFSSILEASIFSTMVGMVDGFQRANGNESGEDKTVVVDVAIVAAINVAARFWLVVLASPSFVEKSLHRDVSVAVHGISGVLSVSDMLLASGAFPV